jgi:hypothetical protein
MAAHSTQSKRDAKPAGQGLWRSPPCKLQAGVRGARAICMPAGLERVAADVTAAHQSSP